MRRVTMLLWVGLVWGCNRPQTAGPTSQPAGTARQSSARIEPANPPATAPAERAPTFVYIEQKQLTFPPAILQVQNRDNQCNAILMSDDPKSAIEDNYHGNSFYLEMPLMVSDPKDLPSYSYQYQAPTSDRTDSPDGIFLDGNRLQLQPLMMQVKFEDAGGGAIEVTLKGTFLEFDTRDDTVPAKKVNVVSQIPVELRVK